MPLTKKAVRDFQKSWANGLINIGKAFTNKEDYKTLAEEFVNNFYGYNEGIVLFKPTLASIEQFRESFEKALSYFIADNPKYPGDQGFALQPWKEVRFRNVGITLAKNHAVATGNYYFTDFDGRIVKVEFTFGFFRNKEGKIRIHLHHSSLPFQIK